MSNSELLIEVLVEELPAIPFLKEHSNILPKWKNLLAKYDLECECEFYYTPRRLVFLSRNFPNSQKSKEVEFFGPPLAMAYDGDKLSKAGESFAKKCGTTEFQTTTKDGKEVLYYKTTLEGKKSSEVLPNILLELLESLNFGKSMRWGSLESSFIRPIRNICILLDEKIVPCDIFGLKSSASTFVHRNFGFDSVSFDTLDSYFGVLKNGGVVLDPIDRKQSIIAQIKSIQEDMDIKVDLDPELLDEIVAITEYPRALYGRFCEDFLALPSEIIITSMKENQRYFATYKDDKLNNGFIVVINSMSEDVDTIISGNEKVLRARLDDAIFFYKNDKNTPLQSYDLSNVAFVDGLGSMRDKSDREGKIALSLLSYIKESNLCKEDNQILNRGDIKELLMEYSSISKSDLLSEMVGEFPELEGIMGCYYAQLEGRDPLVSLSIKEQYLKDSLPSNIFSTIAFMSLKLDNLFALFSIGKIPTGSKDPFGLRRSANGIIKIVLDRGLDFDFSFLQEISKGYKSFDLSLLWDFFIERLENILGLNPSILRCVISSGDKNLNSIASKTRALSEVFEESNKEALVSLFKRVANITKECDCKDTLDPNLFELTQESELYSAMMEVKGKNFEDTKSYIYALFGLKDCLDNFFDNVMVNVEDERIKQNRKALILEIYKMFLQVGDIKEIAI